MGYMPILLPRFPNFKSFLLKINLSPICYMMVSIKLPYLKNAMCDFKHFCTKSAKGDFKHFCTKTGLKPFRKYQKVNMKTFKSLTLLKFHSPRCLRWSTSVFSGWYCSDLLLVMFTEHPPVTSSEQYHLLKTLVDPAKTFQWVKFK